MYRFVGLAVLLAAGFAATVAWGAIPPIIVGPVTTSGPQDTTTAAAATTTEPSTATVTTSRATPAPMTQSASLAVSNRHAKARPVKLTLTLRYEMQCGSPGRGTLTLGLPSQVRVPSRLPASSALLDGKPVNLALASGNMLHVALPAQPSPLCDEITQGTLKLVVTTAANLGNPVHPEIYAVSARAGSRAFRTTLRIDA